MKPSTLHLGILGYPIQHSISPVLHQYLLQKLNLQGCYHLFEVKENDLQDAFRGLQILGFHGCNVTIPHKQTIITFLDQVEPEAEIIGAVNTVLFKNRRSWGFNTDVEGFRRSLKLHNLPLAGKKALVIGAGGAARSVVYALIKEQIGHVCLVNRTLAKARQLVEEFSEKLNFPDMTYELFEEQNIKLLLPEVDLIVNTTSVGMWPQVDLSPVKIDLDLENKVVMDLVYNPVKTKFLNLAAAHGAQIIDGLEMLIFQGVKSLEIWTERKIPVDDLFEKLKNRLIQKLQNHEPN